MDEETKRIRDIVYARTRNATPDQEIPLEWISLYVQFQILDMLDSIDSRFISLEDEVSKLNSMYKS